MPNEMSATLCAEMLEYYASINEVEQWVSILRRAATILRKVERKEIKEVIHGEWHRDKHGHTTCTVCGATPQTDGHIWILSKYCHECGAKMGGQ